MIQNLRIISIAFLMSMNFSFCFAQSYFGIIAGPNLSKFYDYSKDDYYDADYNFDFGATVATFYETEIDSNKFRIELLYELSNANIEILNSNGRASFYKNLKYSIQQVGLNFIYRAPLNKNKKILANICFGPTLDILIQANAKGEGWDYKYYTVLDSNNNPIPMYGKENWAIDGNYSEDMTKIIFGLDFGYDLQTHLNERFDLIIKNDVKFDISSVFQSDDLKYTSLLTFNLGIGICYKL